LNILNTSNDFTRNDLNKFEFGVESFWNDPIENVYAEVTIPIYNINFRTTSSTFKSFDNKNLTGFFDTTGIDSNADEFKARITLYYEGKTTEKIVTLRFKKEIDYLLYTLILGAITAAIILIFSIIWFKKIKKSSNENSKNGKKKKI